MQTGPRQLSELRQKLMELCHSPIDDLAPFLSSHPLVKGTVYTLRRKCSKPSCRCARGERHATVVVTASIGGKTRLWTIPEDRIDEIRERTESYRRFRKARAVFITKCAQRQAEMLRLLDAVEKIRTQQP